MSRTSMRTQSATSAARMSTLSWPPSMCVMAFRTRFDRAAVSRPWLQATARCAGANPSRRAPALSASGRYCVDDLVDHGANVAALAGCRAGAGAREIEQHLRNARDAIETSGPALELPPDRFVGHCFQRWNQSPGGSKNSGLRMSCDTRVATPPARRSSRRGRRRASAGGRRAGR